RVLAELPMQQRERYLRTFLSDHVRSVLGIAAGEPLGSDKGFAELGMDSLMSLELKNRLQQALDTPLPSTLIFKYPSVDDLYTFLATGPLQTLFAQQTADDGDDIAMLLEQELLAIEEAQKR
ncbi:MAG: acyl carrier protein, partial [Burkholderiales bacterium]|nr:acyl carrier protein [Burkholderiales bacterium]